MTSEPGIALVVDDSRVNRLVLTKQLTGLGLEVSEAEHGLEALEQLRAAPSAIDLGAGPPPVVAWPPDGGGVADVRTTRRPRSSRWPSSTSPATSPISRTT